MTTKPTELLTAEQVLDEVDEYCSTKGNPALAPVMREHFSRHGDMAPAVLRSLELEKVTMWRRIS